MLVIYSLSSALARPRVYVDNNAAPFYAYNSDNNYGYPSDTSDDTGSDFYGPTYDPSSIYRIRRQDYSNNNNDYYDGYYDYSNRRNPYYYNQYNGPSMNRFDSNPYPYYSSYSRPPAPAPAVTQSPILRKSDPETNKYVYTPLFQLKATEQKHHKLFVPNLFG